MLQGVQDVQLRLILVTIFKNILMTLRLGRADDGVPSANFSAGFYSGTTSAVANQEFIIPHTFGRTPYLLLPCLPLDQVNAKMVELKVTRAADANNVYLSSPDTSAPIFVYVEG